MTRKGIIKTLKCLVSTNKCFIKTHNKEIKSGELNKPTILHVTEIIEHLEIDNNALNEAIKLLEKKK